MKNQTITLFDVETGGLSQDDNPITQIALINFDIKTFKVNFEWSTFVKPYGGLEISQIALDKSMVTMKDIQNGIDSSKLVKQLKLYAKESNAYNGRSSGNSILGGHNVIGFDRLFMEYLFLFEGEDLYDYYSKEFVDTLTMSKLLWPEESKHNLTVCAERVGYKLSGAHGAMADTRATYAVYKHMVNRMRSNKSDKNQELVEVEEKSEHRKFFKF